MRRTKIVATVGPASETPEVLADLIRAGVDVFRLNMSHGTAEEHGQRLAAIRDAAAETGKRVGILLDLRGPEIRIGTFPGGKVTLTPGQAFTFTTEDVPGRESGVSVSHPGLPRDVEPGTELLLDDGNLVLEAEAVTDTEVRCRVKIGGVLSDRKKINLPGRSVSLPAVAPKDVADIRFGVEHGVDFVAASFVRKAADVLEVRRVLEEAGAGEHIGIIAKIENKEGIDNLSEILQVADGLMVARGDLGVEVAAEDIPIYQKDLIARCNEAAKPVITATQMLESMVSLPRPTRAEASDVANAILDGTDAVMLSAESAVGRYPVQAVQMMARIARSTERTLDHHALLRRAEADSDVTVTDAISRATVSAAHHLGAAAILTATQSGYSARMVSKYRPQARILAVTPNERVVRRLNLLWGVQPVLGAEAAGTDQMTERVIEAALDTGLVQNGDLVVITAGIPAGIPGTTNMLQVQTIGEVAVRGTGIGQGTVTGDVRLVRTVADAAGFRPGEIIVAPFTDADLVPVIEQAAAVICEEGGLTSHAAVVCVSLGIPVIVGATDAMSVLHDGDTVTVDTRRGLVYRGRARAL